MQSQNVRCPSCSRVLKPPDGYDRFRCPCGQVLQRPRAPPVVPAIPRTAGNTGTTAPRNTTTRSNPPANTGAGGGGLNHGRIRCPRCQTVLIPPANAPLFRCTCGVTLRSPNQAGAGTLNRPGDRTSINVSTNTGTTERRGSAPEENPNNQLQRTGFSSRLMNMFRQNKAVETSKPVEDTLFPDEVIANATSKAGEFWLRNLGAGEKLYWVRIMSAEQEEKIAKLLTTWEKDMNRKLEDLELVDLQTRVEQLDMKYEVTNFDDMEQLRKVISGAKAKLKIHKNERQLTDLLNNLNIDHTSCTSKNQYIERLMAAVWYGPTRLCDGFVREFIGDSELTMVPAQQYGLPLNYSEHNISNRDIEMISQEPFKRKVEWFRDICDRKRIPWEQGRVELKINRHDLLRDSFYKVHTLKPEDFKKNFKFEFAGEQGIDAGGLSREWFELIVDACFNVDCGLFEYSGVDNICYQFNPASGIANDLHEDYFRFIGRVVGKALFDGKFIKAHLTQPIFKHILGYPITVDDIQYCDQKIHETLKEIESMEQVEDLYLTFTCTTEMFGETIEHELKEGGGELDVTQANVQEYIMLMTKYFMFERTKSQLTYFLKGIYDVIPEIWLSVFDYKELELLICGLPDINVEDWKQNTKYRGSYARQGANHKVCKWFWEYVTACDQEQRARLLQFCTGTSRVPISGFSSLQGRAGTVSLFTIESVSTSSLIYPRAHTCFNRIDLPEYTSKRELIHRLEEACSMSMTGFNDE